MPERSKTVDQALALVRRLAEDGPGTAAELARRAGINRTVVHRLLVTLDDWGMARRAPEGNWQLGLAFLELAAKTEAGLRRAARPLLDEIAETFGETVVLSVPDGDDVVALDQALGDRHLVRVQYRPGIRHPQTRGAHGRAVLAFAQPARIERLLAGLDDADEIGRRLEGVRRRGYAISHDELQFGASGLAVPVFDAASTVVASIGLVSPVGRLPDEATLAAVILRAAERIGERLDTPMVTSA